MKAISIKVNNDKQTQDLLEFIPKIKGDVILQFQEQELPLQHQFQIEDEYSLFQMDNLQNTQSIIGITWKVKFIVVHNLLKNTFKQIAKNAQVKLIPDWINFRYLANPQNDIANQINESIFKDFDIFSVYCLTNQEKLTKIDFLWQNFNEITKILGSNITIGSVEEPSQYKQLNQFIFIVLQTKNAMTKEEMLQKQLLLNKFVQEKFIISTVVFKIEKTKYKRNELKKIAKDLMNERKTIDIHIGQDQFDIGNFTRVTYVQISIYNDNDAEIQQIFTQRVQNIIELNHYQMQLFDEYISLLPTFQQLQIKYKKMNGGLKVKGQFPQIKQVQILVRDSINQKKSQSIQIKFPQNLNLQVVDQNQLKFAFTQTFLHVLNNSSIVHVEEVTKNYIQIKVNFHKSLNNDILGIKNILEDYINQLQIITLYKDQFSLLEIQLEEAVKKYLAVVMYFDYKYLFMLPKKYLDIMNQKLESQKTMVQYQYKPLSKIFANRIEQDYYSNILQLPADVLGLKYQDNLLYIQCQVRDNSILDLVSQYEKTLENQIISVPLEITELEAKYLSKHFKQDVLSLQEQQNCEINFTFPQQIQENQKDVSEKYFMKFQQKTVTFTYKYNTEIFFETSVKHPLVYKIAYQQKEKVQSNIHIIRDFIYCLQKKQTPYKQVSFIYDDVKNILPGLIKQFMMQEQTKFTQLQLFINDQKNLCEQEAFFILQQSVGEKYQDFQWQWLNGHDFLDYDDILINGQIEKGYQEFATNQAKNEIQLRFPYSQEPGTHTINLAKENILDHANGNVRLLKEKNGIYYIGNEPGDDIFQQFIQEKISKNQNQFTVFLKKYKILYKNRNEIYQVNLDTNFKRKLRRLSIQDPYFKFIADFVHKQINIQTITPQMDETRCWLKFFEKQEMKNNDPQIVKKIQSDLLNLLQRYYVTFTIILPNINDQIFFSFMNYLSQNSIEIIGDAIPSQEIQIKTVAKAQEKILQALEFINSIPAHWNHSLSQSLCTINELEKERILQAFPFLQIKKLESVENYNMWANYQRKKSNQVEQMVMFGSQDVFPLEEVHRITLKFDSVSPFIKCGINHSYIKNKNCFISRKGERQILICQVLFGNPQVFQDEYLLDHRENYICGEYVFIKRTSMYPAYIVTLMDEN